MTPEVSDLMDRLDQSVSSIDITTTALAIHEEKECDVSGVGKLGEQNVLPMSVLLYIGQKEHRLFVCISCTEELEDSVLSSSADNQPDPPELSSLATMDLTSALTSSVTVSDPDIPPAEPSHLLTESTDAPLSYCESNNSPPRCTLSPVTVEDPLCTPPVMLAVENSPGQDIDDTSGPVEEIAEPVVVARDTSYECEMEEPEE